MERLFNILQEEAAQLQNSQRAAASALAPTIDPEPRPVRTPAEMGAKLSLRSTSQPAKRTQRVVKSSKGHAGSSPAPAPGTQPSAQQSSSPGASAAQVVRRALMSRIAMAAKLSAQQKRHQDASSSTAPHTASEPPAQQQTQQGTAQNLGLHTATQHTDMQQHGATQEVSHCVNAASSQPSQTTQQQPDTADAFATDTMHSHDPPNLSLHAAPETSQMQQPQKQQQIMSPDSNIASDTGSAPNISSPPQDGLSQGALGFSPAPASAPATTEADVAIAERQASHGGASTKASSSSSYSSSYSSSSSSSFNSSTLWRADAYEQELVNSNATGMQISFLGTAGGLSSRTR